MTHWSKAHSVKSNARRAARKAGANPNSVRACAGGYQFDLDSKEGVQAAAALPAPKATAKAAGAPTKTAKPKREKQTSGKKPAANGNAKPTVTKPGSKLATVLAMITAAKGATVAELTKATGWLPHTLRARISGLASEHGLKVERERLLGVTTYSAAKKAKEAA